MTATRPLPDEPDAAAAAMGGDRVRRQWRFTQTVLAIALIGFAGWYLGRQWRDASQTRLDVSLGWGWLLAASALVFATYLFLVELWRRILTQFGAVVSLRHASRIWFVSNLGKYVPGKIWQVTTMATMLSSAGVGLGIAARASALITIANVVAGLALVLVVGTPALRLLGARYQVGALVVVIVVSGLLLLAPVFLRVAARALRRWFRADARQITIPRSATILGVVGCLVAWLLYGIAFRLFVLALLGKAEASWASYIAVYVLSYLVGYLVIFAPGGLGPREATLSALLIALHMATPAEAAVITIASRLWLSVLEVLPAAAFLMIRPRGLRLRT